MGTAPGRPETGEKFYYRSVAATLQLLMVWGALVAAAIWSLIYIPVLLALFVWTLFPAVPGVIKCSRELLNVRPKLILTRDSVYWRDWPFKSIEWANIERFNVFEMDLRYRRVHFLEFTVRDPLLLREKTAWWLFGWNIVGFKKMSINLSLMDVDVRELEKDVQFMHLQYGQR